MKNTFKKMYKGVEDLVWELDDETCIATFCKNNYYREATFDQNGALLNKDTEEIDKEGR